MQPLMAAIVQLDLNFSVNLNFTNNNTQRFYRQSIASLKVIANFSNVST